MNINWFKRFLLILAASVIGYLLVLHAGMSSDADEYLKWYYAVEFFVAVVLCWPIAIYLGLQYILGVESNILDVWIWIIQIVGYLAMFQLYDKYKRKK